MPAEREATQLSQRAVWRLLGAVALIQALDHLPPPSDPGPAEDEGASLVVSDV